MTDFLFNIPPGDIAYDIETYPNTFTLRATHCVTGDKWLFEMSFRRWDLYVLCLFIEACQRGGNRWVGYNNIGFDYPVVHHIYQHRSGFMTVGDIYKKAMSIINAPFNAKFAHLVWESDHLVPQIDLYKIHHFDNMARATSLKVLEFNMRMDNIEDLPFDVGLDLNSEQADVLLDYNDHDVDATVLFYHETKEQIDFREKLTEKLGKNFINHNDTKIGKDFFIMELEKVSPGCCYRMEGGRKRMVQTHRDDGIRLSDIILPYVKFDNHEFQRILIWMNNQTITETKGSFKEINCNINGFQYDFGTGGIHGSVDPQIVSSDEHYTLLDIDVASYYPNIAIANGLYPEHLGQAFCQIYKELYEERKRHKKGSAENAMLKLALNGVYGDSNNQYSPFFDPQYTMSITINGQLMLCMLAEALLKCDAVTMIQINTDGMTIKVPRTMVDWVGTVSRWWEQITGLELEQVEYSRMMIRDVNNYIAEEVDGKLKRKGAYVGIGAHQKDYKLKERLGWHQNHSALVVPKAAEAALVYGVDIREFITKHSDPLDFMLRAKVPRSNVLEWGGNKVSNIVRYYVSHDGDILEKIMPPAGPVGQYKRKNGLLEADYQAILSQVGDEWDERIHTKNQSKYAERRSGINTGWTVMLCNNLDSREFAMFDETVNHEFYIAEAQKLVQPLLDK